MRRAVSLLLAVVSMAGAAGCGGDSEPAARAKGDTLTVYASLPAHGDDADAGRAAAVGMRRALADARGRAGDRRVRLVVLPSTRPGDERWDPGTVEANAERAVDDGATIAYLGELDQGGSAVSLPVTNRAGILQVSPADGLTSLTRRPPGRPRAGPERYYPEGRRNFVRLVPADLEIARAIVDGLHERGARRLAVVDGQRISDHELEGMVLALIGTGMPKVVVDVAVRDADEPEQVREQGVDLAEELLESRPDAILYSGAAGPEAGALLSGIATRLPDVPLWGGAPLASGAGRFARAPEGACAYTAVAASSQGTRPARRVPIAPSDEIPVHRRADAMHGYDAMRLTLDAIEQGGADRAAVVAAARRPGVRRGTLGRYSIDRRGDATGRALRCAALTR